MHSSNILIIFFKLCNFVFFLNINKLTFLILIILYSLHTLLILLYIILLYIVIKCLGSKR